MHADSIAMYSFSHFEILWVVKICLKDNTMQGKWCSIVLLVVCICVCFPGFITRQTLTQKLHSSRKKPLGRNSFKVSCYYHLHSFTVRTKVIMCVIYHCVVYKWAQKYVWCLQSYQQRNPSSELHAAAQHHSSDPQPDAHHRDQSRCVRGCDRHAHCKCAAMDTVVPNHQAVS